MGRFPSIDQTVALNYEGGGWESEGLLTNPGINTLYADTGQLTAGIYDFDVIIVATAAVLPSLQHRNAANTATLFYQVMYASALMYGSISIRSYKMATNERLRVFNTAALVGSVQASIFNVRRIG